MDSKLSDSILSPNPAQMRVLEGVFVPQPIAKHAVKAGVGEQDYPCE